MAHDQPTYASVPGIRVFGKSHSCLFTCLLFGVESFTNVTLTILAGMMCVKPGNTNNLVRKPQPPKRDQYQQSPYYQRYKKHATNSPYPESERMSRQTDFSDSSTIPTISSGQPTESYANDADQEAVDEGRAVDDLNALPQEVQTRIKRMIDQLSVNTNSISRQSRSIADGQQATVEEEDDSSRRSNSFNNDLWPDVSWHEINKQIGDIHWKTIYE